MVFSEVQKEGKREAMGKKLITRTFIDKASKPIAGSDYSYLLSRSDFCINV